MSANNATQSLGTDSIGRLLFQYSLPAIIATAASSIYNIVDRIFIGQGVGPYAISGLALTLPLMNIFAAFGAVIGVGASTMVSIYLGQKNDEDAVRTLGNAFVLNIILSIITSTIGYIFLDDILMLMGASEMTLPYAREFMEIALIGNLLIHVYLGLNHIMRASGFPQKSMYVTLITVAINITLAPIYIFVFHWGIRGAALATLCGQIVGTIIVLHHFMNHEKPLHFAPGCFKLKGKIISNIFMIGLPNFVMLLLASMVAVIMNRSLGKYGGDFAIGAFGIINSLLNLIAMIVAGFTQGMQPIAGFNFGARNLDRVKQVFKLTLVCGSSVTIFGFLVSELFPRFISSLFTTDEQLIELAAFGLRIALAAFAIVGIQMVTSNFFQSIGRPKISLILTMLRQLIFLIPTMLILPHIGNLGLTGVWLSMPVSDTLAAIATIGTLIYFVKVKKIFTNYEYKLK
jgi:putative MATE family efflux protein